MVKSKKEIKIMTFLQSWKESLLIFTPHNLKKFLTDFVTIFLGTYKRLIICWAWLIIGMIIATYYANLAVFGWLIFIFYSAVYLSAYQSFARRAFASIKEALPALVKFFVAQILVSIIFGLFLSAILIPLGLYFTVTTTGKTFFMQYGREIDIIVAIVSIPFKGIAVIMPFFAFYFYDSNRNFSWWSSFIKALKATLAYYPACWLLGIFDLLIRQVVLGLMTDTLYIQLAIIIYLPLSTALCGALYQYIRSYD
jgi:hypothetical protein